MRLHVLGMAFSELTRDWSHCAFTQRTFDFCNMMQEQGYEVFAYGGEHYALDVTKHVTCITREEQEAAWPDYIAKAHVFNSFDNSGIGWRTFNARAAAAIARNAEPGDVLCLTMGTSHQPVAEALPDLFHVETGIGYSGVWAPYRIYESWAWRNHITGKYMDDNVRFYDCVLPRAYPAEDFPLGKGDGDYYLFIGRLIERKGPHIAALACQRLGAKLLVAGQGEYPLEGDVEYVGVVGPEERARLMGGAIATFCPSIYLEPFCGVSVEAQLVGCPVIASNWGGLVENVDHGTTGFLCDTLAEFTSAAEMAADLDRPSIQKVAHDRWSTDVLGPHYVAYFDRLATLRGDGWYS